MIRSAGSAIVAATSVVAGGLGALLEPSARAVQRRALRQPAIGVASNRSGDYLLAIRIPEAGLRNSPLVERMSAAASGEVDVRVTGVIRAHSDPSRTARTRPMEIGYSIAHERGTAGTTGCFVTTPWDSAVHLVSSNHVLADCNKASVGDAVLQPGPLDGGLAEDAIGVLSHVETLSEDEPNAVDVALARLHDDVAFEPATLGGVGRLQGLGAPPDGDELVEKLGRTTGHTKGRVSAFGVIVPDIRYPGNLWVTLAEQVEIEGLDGAFSEPGDSGSLIFTSRDHRAFALLNGGDDAGYTFASPLPTLFTRMGLALAG